MNLVTPGDYANGFVGNILTPDSRLLVQANNFRNFMDLSPEANPMDLRGDSKLTASGLSFMGTGQYLKTQQLNNSNSVTFRFLAKAERITAAGLGSVLLGSIAGTRGIALSIWGTGGAPGAYGAVLRMYIGYTRAGAPAMTNFDLALPYMSGLSAAPTDSGWVYCVGKLDGPNKTLKIKVMNAATSFIKIFDAGDDVSASASGRGVLDTLGLPLVHNIADGYGNVGDRRSTVAKAEIFHRYTTDAEDLAQYQADKTYLCPQFGISTVGWA